MINRAPTWLFKIVIRFVAALSWARGVEKLLTVHCPLLTALKMKSLLAMAYSPRPSPAKYHRR